MQKRRLAKTDIEVSVIGLGTVKIGRREGVKYPASFELPTDKELDQLLHVAADLGINLLDTAPAYGSSEDRLGKVLRGERQRWVISTKAGEEFVDGESRFDFSPSAIQASVERSLKRLRTDYLDVVLIHSNGDDERVIHEDGVFETLGRLKQEGKLRAYGMSTKTIAGGLKTIEQTDVAMVSFNSDYTDEREVIAHAMKQQKGIFIKKALASGHLSAGKALEFVLQEPGITSVIIGTINPVHLRENVRVLR